MNLLLVPAKRLAGLEGMEALLPLTLFCFTAMLVNVCRLR